MEHQAIGDAVLDTTHIPDSIPHWVTCRSPEAVEIQAQLEAIARFFDDLDAALDALEPWVDVRAYQLSHAVRAEMLKSPPLGAAEN